jgi:hypothetical protein
MDVQPKIEKWLDERGYSLEMRVAQTLRRNALSVIQSEFYLDPDSKQPRETDAVAYQDRRRETKQLLVAMVVECKVSTDKPWVLFTQAHEYSPELSIQRHAATFYTQGPIIRVAQLNEAQTLGMFALPERVGYSLVVALGDQNDKAYAALMSVLSATKGIVEDLKRRSSSQSLHAFALPIIVVKGKLFESFLDAEGSMRIEEISKGTLLWRNRVLGVVSTITIVPESAFEAYAKGLATDSARFADLLMAEIIKG